MHTVLLEAGHEVGLEALVVQPPLVQLRLEVSNLRFWAEVSGIYAAHSEVPAKSWSRPRLPPSHAFQNEAGKVSPPPPLFTRRLAGSFPGRLVQILPASVC